MPIKNYVSSLAIVLLMLALIGSLWGWYHYSLVNLPSKAVAKQTINGCDAFVVSSPGWRHAIDVSSVVQSEDSGRMVEAKFRWKYIVSMNKDDTMGHDGNASIVFDPSIKYWHILSVSVFEGGRLVSIRCDDGAGVESVRR